MRISRHVNKYDVVLCQWVEKGDTITWATKVFNMVEYLVPESHAVFKIKLKDKRTFIQKCFDFGRYRKYWMTHLIASQVNKKHAIKSNTINP